MCMHTMHTYMLDMQLVISVCTIQTVCIVENYYGRIGSFVLFGIGS